MIEKCFHEEGEFIPPIFLRPKKNKKYRMILNLKKLNKHIAHIHFEMDTLQSCINLMNKNCYMGSLYLTYAYYSVSISPESQKYLKFKVGCQLYKFITLPNGLSSAPRIFTKLMKPVYILRTMNQRPYMTVSLSTEKIETIINKLGQDILKRQSCSIREAAQLSRIVFKILLLTYKALNGHSPTYLRTTVSKYRPYGGTSQNIDFAHISFIDRS